MNKFRSSRDLGRRSCKFLLLSLVLFLTGIAPAFARTYYVSSVGGCDSTGDGSFANPWKTIQKGAENLVAGDVLEIREGTYRETVIPSKSGTVGNPITYRAYNGEEVTVSGADAVTGWELHRDNIYKAPLDWAPQAIFVDGVDMIQARWPNKTSLDKLTLDDLGVVDDGSSTTLTAKDLHGDDDYWNGAMVWFTGGGERINWTAQTATITGYDSATQTITFEEPFINWWHRIPAKGSNFYISGLLSELDSENEWHYEDGYVYLWAPGGVDPSALTVEAKARKWAFDLSDKNYIELRDLNVFAASANLEDATHSVIDNAKFKYLSSDPVIHYTYSRGGYGDHVKVAPWWDSTWNDVGIYLGGSHNTLMNSEAAYSYGDIVTVVGENNTVKNNILHDGNISATETGIISVRGKNHDILANTMYNAGRSVLQFNYVESSRFMYNDMHSPGLLTRDLGVAYCYITNGRGTVIANNWIHSNNNPGFATGIYLDNGSSNFIVHHNVLWDIRSGEAIFYNVPSDNVQSYNNTTYQSGGTHSIKFDPPMTNAKTYNNLSDKPFMGNDLQNNVQAAADFVGGSDDGLQFRPTSSSPAINAGRVIEGITDDYVGAAPDAGAYEYGGYEWIAGHEADVSHLPPLPPAAIPDVLKINNAEIGIEYSRGWDFFPAYYDYPAYRGAYFADLHIAREAGEYFEYEFEGHYIEWIGSKSHDYGMADVYIDDVLVASDVDSYRPKSDNPDYPLMEHQATLFVKDDLAPGTHTIKIVLNGNKHEASEGYQVSLDALVSKRAPSGPDGPVGPIGPEGPIGDSGGDESSSFGIPLLLIGFLALMGRRRKFRR